MSRRRLLVVGNGMAGVRTVEEILARGGAEQFQITVVGDEPYGNYNRILLSHVLAGDTDIARPGGDLFLNPVEWYGENGVTLRAGVRVTRLDTFARTVRCDDGSTTDYDVLVIATGSHTFFPPMDGLRDPTGALTPGVFGFRTLDDTHGMLAVAGAHSTAVVIGGGLLGLEAAHGLAQHGATVHVVHSPAHLMNQQLDARGGRLLRLQVEALGLTVHTSTRTTAVLTGDDGRVRGVRFADGGELTCDTVVVTAGTRANTELGLTGGLVVERAIVVDDQLRCEDQDDVYAVGECAQHRGEVYGLVAPLWEQAVVLAEHLTGNPVAAYHGSRLATKLKVAGVDVAAMGMTGPERDDDEFVQLFEPRNGTYRSVVVRDGKLVGATLVGDVSKASFLTQAFDDKVALPDQRIELLFDLGTADAATGAAGLADDAQVCSCNGVSKAQLVACVHGGATTVAQVCTQTRAGKGCGSCKGLVAQVVELAAGGSLAADPATEHYVPCIPMSKAQLVTTVREQGLRAVSQVFAALGVEEEATAKMPLASLLKMVWGQEYVDERGALFVNDRVHANIQRDGTFSVVPQMKGGVTTPAQLKRIAEVAERYEVPLVKVTGGQRIDLLGIRKEDLPAVWADLDMPSGYAYGKSFRTVKTCVGTDFCRFGLGDSTALGIAIEERFQGLESPAKLKLAVAGCPRNCSEALCKDVGVVAVGEGRWEVYVGGAAGAHVRKGDLLATVDSPEAVLTLVGRFLQAYREDARWLERTYAWVPRTGLDRLHAVLVDDVDGVVAGLDQRLQTAVEDYRDPWQDRAQPRSANQFRSSLPLHVLPQVPVR